jgi:hypothetical protein
MILVEGKEDGSKRSTERKSPWLLDHSRECWHMSDKIVVRTQKMEEKFQTEDDYLV